MANHDFSREKLTALTLREYRRMKKTVLGALALTMALVSPAVSLADEAQTQLPPQLQAIGVTQATDVELAEVRGEFLGGIAKFLGGWAGGEALTWAVNNRGDFNPSGTQVYGGNTANTTPTMIWR